MEIIIVLHRLEFIRALKAFKPKVYHEKSTQAVKKYLVL